MIEVKLLKVGSKVGEKMNELIIFLQGLPSAFEMAFIYSIMVMGVYITYKILDFPDLSVDGTFPLGGFVFAAFALSPNGFFGITSPIVGLILSALAGALAGYATGYLHVEKKIDKLLSGILVMTALYSINSRVVGSPNVFITPERSIYEVVTYEKHFFIFALFSVAMLGIKMFYDYKIKENKYVIRSISIYILILLSLLWYTMGTKNMKLLTTVLLVFVIKMLIDYVLTSKFGFALRALGDNENLVIGLGVNEKKLKIYGLMISNSLVALSGALFAQYIKVADIQGGVGTIVVGLASIIFGLGVLKKSKTINDLSIVIVGTIMYYSIIYLALESNNWSKILYKSLNFSDSTISLLEIKPTDLKIITALILVIVMGIGLYKKKRQGKRGK